MAASHGVEGILKENLIDVQAVAAEEIKLLRTTPAAGAIGTCRYKLTEHQQRDFSRIIDVFAAHNVGYFFYIGGNDSMDTAAKVNHLAQERGVETIVVGVPKTIDNDVGDEEFRLIDHTPGYGSAARYWVHVTQLLDEEDRGMCTSERVCVIQAMGRNAGFIPAAARLADPGRTIPLQLYLAESKHTIDSLTDNVADQLRRDGRCIVVVSGGFNVGSLGETRDAFGHIEYGASQTTVAQTVVNHLNRVGLPVHGQVTGQIPGVLQRSTSIFASTVDVEEAYQVGRKAVDIAIDQHTGYMATILRRQSGTTYEVYYDKVPLSQIANSQRTLPASWLSENHLDVADDFVRYARPLLGEGWPSVPMVDGVQRFARIQTDLVQKRPPKYIQ